MNIQSVKFGLACALTASVLWVVCSILVMIIPSTMLSMSGAMLHLELLDMGWHLTLWGVVKGLVAWFFTAGVSGWIIATTYNRLI